MLKKTEKPINLVFVTVTNINSFKPKTMTYLALNMRWKRKSLGWTQEELAERLGVGRSVIGSYEEGRAEPRNAVLMALARLFDCTIEDLLQADGEAGQWGPSLTSRVSGDSLRILTVGVEDSGGKEQISLVPEQAAAGYLQGHRDADYVARLPAFRLPVPELSSERTYRLFQIKGDSMLPVPDGSYVVAEFAADWRSIRAGQCAVVLSRGEGLVYKRIYPALAEGYLELRSDHPAYKPYRISLDQVMEMWKVLGYLSFRLPDAHGENVNDSTMWPRLQSLATELQGLVYQMKG